MLRYSKHKRKGQPTCFESLSMAAVKTLKQKISKLYSLEIASSLAIMRGEFYSD